MGFQYYAVTMNHAVVQTESILTQAVFNHSLRVRVVSEGSEKGSEDNQKKKDTSIFIGKLSNLVTSDMATMGQASYFAMVCEFQRFNCPDLRDLCVMTPLFSLVSPSSDRFLLRVSLHHSRMEVGVVYHQ